MKKTFTLLSLVFLSFNASRAQVPSVQWKNHYGGSLKDNVSSVCKTSDGGFVTVGFTESNDIDAVGQHGSGPAFTRDVLAIKTNSVGTIIWKRVIGGTSNDVAASVIEASNGDIVMVGYSESTDGDFSTLTHRGAKDLLVLRLTSSGATVWAKKFGGTDSEEANAVKEDASGNLVIAGYSGSNDFDVTGNHLKSGSPTKDFWVLKLDNMGTAIWKKCYGGSTDSFNSWGDEEARALTIAPSGFILVSGYSNSIDGDVTSPKGGRDFWLISLTASNGNMSFQKSFGGTAWEEAYSSDMLGNNDLLITGYTQSNDIDVSGLHGSSNKDIWLVKMNLSSGNITSQKCIGGSSGEVGYCIKSTSDGGAIISGYAQSQDGDCPVNYGGWDWWVVKLNATLNLSWQKNIGGALTELGGYGIVETNSGEYLVAGIASNLFEGSVGQFYGSEDYWVVKLGANSVGLKENEIENSINAYPNPTSGIFNIALKENSNKNSKVEVLNSIGQVIYQSNFEGTNIKITIENEPTGIYMIRITTDNSIISKKIIKN